MREEKLDILSNINHIVSSKHVMPQYELKTIFPSLKENKFWKKSDQIALNSRFIPIYDENNKSNKIIFFAPQNSLIGKHHRVTVEKCVLLSGKILIDNEYCNLYKEYTLDKDWECVNFIEDSILLINWKLN